MTRLGLRRKTAYSFLICIILWLAGFAWFIHIIPTHEAEFPERSADAIVVLTGGANRLEYGLELLAGHKADVLFVSGAGAEVTVADILKQAPAGLRKSIPASSIILGHQAENTIGNAEETARWLEGTHYKSILLVTANYHMPRSLVEFSAALPSVIITPAPASPGDIGRELLLSEYHKYLASKLRHWFVSATQNAG